MLSVETLAPDIALAELDALDRILAQRKRAQGVKYFVPNRPQLDSLQSPARHVLCVWGNRAGKSSRGAFELACHLTGWYPACPCHGDWIHPHRRRTRPLAAVVVVSSFAILERAIEPRILSLLPAGAIAQLKRSPQGFLRRIVMQDGSTVDILTNEMDQMAFESAAWSFAWIDEPTQRAKFNAILRGLVDTHGTAVLTFTPLIEPWIKDELIDQAPQMEAQVFEASSFVNTQTVHGAPILPHDAIQRFADSLPEEERQVRIEGRFFHLRGIVYQGFDSNVHVKEVRYEWPDPVIAVLDPHDRIPHHVLWAFVDRRDWLFIDQELVMTGTVKDLARAILRMEATLGYRMARRLIDPNFGRKPLITTGQTVIDELRGYGVQFGEAGDDVATGILAVKDYLHFRKDQPLGLTNAPRMYFHPRCQRTIRSVRNLQYEEWGQAMAGERDAKETPKDKDDHGADCVRYLCISRPRFERFHAPVPSGLDMAVY